MYIDVLAGDDPICISYIGKQKKQQRLTMELTSIHRNDSSQGQGKENDLVWRRWTDLWPVMEKWYRLLPSLNCS
jgi:hypothetical protein